MFDRIRAWMKREKKREEKTIMLNPPSEKRRVMKTVTVKHRQGRWKNRKLRPPLPSKRKDTRKST